MRTLMQQKAFELKYEMLCERTRRRQDAAKADLVRRGVAPRVNIGSSYVPPRIARVYTHMNVRGLA